MRLRFFSGAEYITVATTTKVAPITNLKLGRKSNRTAVMIQEMTILKLVAKTFKTEKDPSIKRKEKDTRTQRD